MDQLTAWRAQRRSVCAQDQDMLHGERDRRLRNTCHIAVKERAEAGKLEEQGGAAARDAVLEDELVVKAEVSAVIVYFYFDDTDIDLDNIAKPILDALPSIVYGDDSQIAQLLLRRTDLRGREIQDPSPRLLGALAQAIDELRDFVYIRVTDEAVAHERLP